MSLREVFMSVSLSHTLTLSHTLWHFDRSLLLPHAPSCSHSPPVALFPPPYFPLVSTLSPTLSLSLSLSLSQSHSLPRTHLHSLSLSLPPSHSLPFAFPLPFSLNDENFAHQQKQQSMRETRRFQDPHPTLPCVCGICSDLQS